MQELHHLKVQRELIEHSGRAEKVVEFSTYEVLITAPVKCGVRPSRSFKSRKVLKKVQEIQHLKCSF